ncbi:MAG: hypothetical protein K2O97_07000, partial [Acetatifactor sp.]|nr:hypothetical protein [Acetatifactor sp.]
MRDNRLSLTENGFWYGGEFRELNERTVLLDGSLTEEAATGRHVYRDILEAFSGPELTADNPDRNKGGRELPCTAPGQPVTVYIAPNVYWIDDPAATDILQKKEGYSLPFGMYVNCGALRIVGLSDNPEDVVIAGNRGQSHACNGNYTMFCFQVEELTVSNLTLGN